MKKKVIMFGWEFPPHNSGGLGVACFGLTKALSKKNIEVLFILPKKFDGINSNLIKIINPTETYSSSYIFDSPISPYITERKYKSLFFERTKNYSGSLIEEVMRYAEFGEVVAGREKFDIIHAHDWLSFGAGIRAKIKSKKPLIAHVHATEYDRGGGSGVNPLVYRLEKEGMEYADKVIAVSNFTKNIIINNYHINPEKIEVVHNGIEFEKDNPLDQNIHKIKLENKKVVLFVGRLTLQKGPDYFIKAAKKVCDYTEDVYFVISGSGDMENMLIEQVASYGISDRVFFTGFLRNEELRKMYKMSDLFVMPSVSEPFGITPLESLVNGTPVLLSKQSGVSEVISNVLLVDFWDTDEMANKILTALHQKPLLKSLKENGQKDVQKVTWERAAEKCIAIYNSLI